MVDGRHLAKHPDENLLTAFAERSLTPKERQSVTEHLSTCARCRDVVFVAQQASLETADQSERSSVADTVGRRLWWESLGVAGILAALLIAVPIVVYRHRSHPIQSGREQIASENRLATPTAESGPSSDSMSAVQTRPAEQASKKAVKRASSAAAIKGRAEIIGSVADRTGAAIPGAHVTVRGASSGNTRTVLTNPQGQFDVASLPSGSYQVEVQAPGFNTFSQPVTVQPSERASLDAKLDVGAATQTVSVTASKGGVAAGIIGGLATSSSPTGGPMIRNRDTASVPPSGRNITPAAAPATPTLTPQAPVAAQLHPVTTGPLASGMVANGAALTATFAVKDGAVQRCIGTE
ncbi:MAG TPA: carboxypeptidase regulatory-like domain-containing protein, partial [Silvibacterium sp.]|nr:carboxypeptidase regulatory-like domain-containing protein [Silvibacterium sp.]